ncbi:MAG: hypothetical protein PHF65_07005 [Oscillospiraceae bacterium]|nr:hypothetical protein [Oscillospiraceae bacterium]
MNRGKTVHPAKRIVITALSLLLGWSVVACSPVKESPAKESPERIVAAYFDVVEHSFSEEFEESVLILEDRIVASFVVYPEDDIEAFSSALPLEVLPEDTRVLPERRLEIYDYDGNLIHCIALDQILVPTDRRQILLESPAGGFCVFSTYTEQDSSDASCQLAYFSDTGTHVKTQTISINRNDLNFVDSACILPNGELCVLGTTANWTSQIYIFSEKGRCAHSIPTKEYLFQGNLLLINEQLYLYASVVREDLPRGALFLIDTASGKISEPSLLPVEYPVDASVLTDGEACYGYDRQKLVEYDLNTGEVRAIIRWYDTEGSVNPIAALKIFPDQKIVCVGFSLVTGKNTISVLTGTDRDPLANKTQIVVAGLDLEDDDIVRKHVYSFENAHPECRVILRDYMNEISPELSWKQMIPELRRIILNDFFLDNAPDIYLDINQNLSLIDYSVKDDLLNLSPYLEKLSDEHYIMDVLLGAQTHGNVYCVPASFTVNCFSGLPDTIPERGEWTIKEFDQMATGLPAGTSAQSFFTKQELLSWALQSSMREFVDYEQLRADFSSDAFISLLEWANRYGSEESFDTRDAALDFEWIGGIESVLHDYDVSSGNFRTYIGFPGEHSKALDFYPRYIMAISSVTEESDLCWDFIALALSDEFQNTSFPYDNPVNRNAVQSSIDASLTLLESFSTDGDPYVNADKEAAVAIYWDILERADNMLTISDSVSAIVTEESSACFAGQKTADEVARIIQNRVQNMLDERR